METQYQLLAGQGETSRRDTLLDGGLSKTMPPRLQLPLVPFDRATHDLTSIDKRGK